MKQPLFNKNMNVQMVQEAADKRWNELNNVGSYYLNRDGRALMEILSVISSNCTFAHDPQELIKFIHEDMNNYRFNYDEAVKMLEAFEKIFS